MLIHFLLLSSQSLVSLREEAYSSHKPNEHRVEPHRSSDWWDVQKGLRAQSALHNGGSGHDPTAAQTPRKCQCQGNRNLPFSSSMHLPKSLFFFFFFTLSDLFCQFHISGCFLFSSAVGTCSENIRQWKAFHWCWWALDLCADMTTSVKSSQKKCWDCSKKTFVSLENKTCHTVNYANTLKGGFLGLVLSFPVRKVDVGERCTYSWDSSWNFFRCWIF